MNGQWVSPQIVEITLDEIGRQFDIDIAYASVTPNNEWVDNSQRNFCAIINGIVKSDKKRTLPTEYG